MVKQETTVSPRSKQRSSIAWGAWIWLAPALVLEITFFLYPLIDSIRVSFLDKDSIKFVGLRNYTRLFTNPDLLETLRNNLIWLVLASVLTVGLGLLIAVLIDRVKIERVVKSTLFIPMAISFVAAGVIWKFVYAFEPADQTQIGLLNGIVTFFGGKPHAWVQEPPFNNLALIAVFTWMWAGYCMVILSAALKGIPDEIIEAAKIDGAGRVTMFWRVMVPMISPTIAVVTTTMVISILKIFDVVYVMTGGNYHTNVIAVDFYRQLFTIGDYGQAGALAVFLLITVIPIMYYNVRAIREGGARR
jgi:alpha-glucoside transport system permease protein